MSVVVSGGAGFLGSHLVDKLVAAGGEAIVFDTLFAGRLANLAKAIATGRTTFVYADVASSAASLNKLIDDAKPASPVSAVYHFASCSSDGTASLIDVAAARRACFVLVGEPELTTAQQDLVLEAARSRGLRAVSARVFGPYGPRMNLDDGGVLASMLSAILRGDACPIPGNGEQAVDVTYADDAVSWLAALPGDAACVSGTIDIAGAEASSPLQLAGLLSTIAGVSRNAAFTGTPAGESRVRPNLAAARAHGWSPRTPLRDGLNATYLWASDALLTHI